MPYVSVVSRFPHLLLSAAVLWGAGADYRTENFIVTADDSETARSVALEAERHRRELASQWMNRELPAWGAPCPIRVHAAADVPANGSTSFVFINGKPQDWRMTVQGSRPQIFGSVLPHEVAHTVFATHFGRALPRWVEEGICVVVEHGSTQQNLERLVVNALRQGYGINLERMFRMKHYPRDVRTFYSQGYSLTRFLLEQGGEQKLIRFIRDGLNANDWQGVTQKHYGYETLGDLQRQWTDWVLLAEI